MYQSLLSTRYLRTRIIPLIAVGAVALCVALVITVVSVMTGFLDMVKNSGRTLIGDVSITYAVQGVPFYDRLVDLIDALPESSAATPAVEGWGLMKMPYPDGRRKETRTVSFWGIVPPSYRAVTGYEDTLIWYPPSPDELVSMSDDDFRRTLLTSIGADGLERIRDEGLTLQAKRAGSTMPGVCMGIHVSVGNDRQSDGSYRPAMGRNGYWWMPVQDPVVLTSLPLDTLAIAPEPESVALQIVNEFSSGVYMIDKQRVIIPLATAQRLLHLDASEIIDEEGLDTGFQDPPRATAILVRAAEGVTPDRLREAVVGAYDTFREELRVDPLVWPDLVPPDSRTGQVQIQTWREQQRQFIDPIEKERELMRTLFSMVYIVCAGLVLSIFWAIVQEKTRDIGILRSLGASRLGISWIFLRYGLWIGVLGALLGLGLAWTVTSNINLIHDAMGDPPLWLSSTFFILAGCAAAWLIRQWSRGFLLPRVLGVLLFLVLSLAGTGVMVAHWSGGIVIWDPAIYYFNTIPNKVDWITAWTTMVGAILFSVLGAFFPAARAADTDLVKALRYE